MYNSNIVRIIILSFPSYAAATGFEQAALVNKVRNMHKTELHLHLGGSWPMEFLQTIATPEQMATLTTLIDQFDNKVDYHKAFKVFDVLGSIVNTEEKIEAGVAALCKQLADDHVVYAELRSGARDMGSGLEGYVQAVLRGIEHGCAETDMDASLLLSVRRDTPARIVEQTINLINHYRNRGVVGLDISGISTQGDCSAILQAAQRIKELRIPITLHIGESPEETEEQQIKELLTLKPQRVGHCVHLHPAALEWIRNNRVPVEMCLTSAVKVRMIERYDQHPALKLIQAGHPVVICTDDPLIFKTSVSDECLHYMASSGASIDDLVRLQATAYAHGFA